MVAIAMRTGIIEDFYKLRVPGVFFTAGKQRNIGQVVHVQGKPLDISRAQIEIDAGLEWTNTIVLVEAKSTLQPRAFDVKQVIYPLLKWKGLLPKKKIFSVVMLSNVRSRSVVFRFYDMVPDSRYAPFGSRIKRSFEYEIIT